MARPASQDLARDSFEGGGWTRQTQADSLAVGQQIKGIRIELSGLKNCLVRSNQLRYEYVSRKEEGERLKKLGSAPAEARTAGAGPAGAADVPAAEAPAPAVAPAAEEPQPQTL